MGALLLCSEGAWEVCWGVWVAGQQAPRTEPLTNGRMLWDRVSVCVCAVELHGG